MSQVAHMAHHAVENNPKKEIMYALVGIVLFLAMVLLIAISAYLRPAGNHVDVKALNAAQAAKTAASATPVTAATAAAASGETTASPTVPGATGPDTTLASPDNAKQAAADKPKDTPDAGVASQAAVADRKEKTADAKQDITAINGKAPNIDAPVTETDSKTGEAKVTSTVPAAQEKPGSTKPGQATQ